ncbi:MAG: branched-chain amino acid ABC transporter permease [Dehalococcoidia bacterium]|nr:MAG: branched-chain amino acid ABC transporter permease [Dehalococcoidia bacterium]
MTVETLLQQVINALSLGSLYALLALGLSMVYGVLKLMNFAHGELVTITAYTMWFLASRGVSFPIVVVAGIAAATVVALLTELIAFRQLRKASFATVLIASFAVSVIIQNLIRQFISPRPRGIRVPAVFDAVLRFGFFHIGALSLITLAISLIVMALLAAFLRRTRWGIALRAAAADFEVARLVGVRANRIISLAFATAGFLAGIGGVLWVCRIGGMTPSMGLTPVIKSFVANVIGGLGSFQGAVLGGYILAFLDIFLQVFLPAAARPFIDAFSLAVVVIILYFRPEGLMRKRSEA